MPDDDRLKELAKKKLFGANLKGSVKPGAFPKRNTKIVTAEDGSEVPPGYYNTTSPAKIGKLGKDKVNGDVKGSKERPVKAGDGMYDRPNAFGESGKFKNQTGNFKGEDKQAKNPINTGPQSPRLIPKSKTINPSPTGAGRGMTEKVSGGLRPKSNVPVGPQSPRLIPKKKEPTLKEQD